MESACCVKCEYNVAVGKRILQREHLQIEVNIVSIDRTVYSTILPPPQMYSFSKVLNSYCRAASESYVRFMCALIWKLKLAKVAERDMEFFMENFRQGVGILNLGGGDGVVMRFFSVSVVMLYREIIHYS